VVVKADTSAQDIRSSRKLSFYFENPANRVTVSSNLNPLLN
jgi:hypothetical protein